MSKEQLIRLLRSSDSEWIVSSTPFECPEEQSKVYLRRKVGKSGGFEISGCLPKDEVERLKDELREYLRRDIRR